uniref:Uncharacterized protein n=1 Tax=Timema shepardi TaxID=629360 RepID=A0A7R9FXL6_TIMSH|nr:unnamed protein product [Timema shepardi]
MCQEAEKDESADRHVERVYCSHLFHLECLITFMKTPPFHEIWRFHSPRLTNSHQVSPSPTETSPRQIGRTCSLRRIHSRGLGNDDCLRREPNQRLAQTLKNAVANLTSQTSAPRMFQFSLVITGTSADLNNDCTDPVSYSSPVAGCLFHTGDAR